MKNICIDARYIFPQMDGIGRYLYNLIDKISMLDTNGYHFHVLEMDVFAHGSILRKFESRNNITFHKISVFPQSFRNLYINSLLKGMDIDLFHYPQFDLPWFIGEKIAVITTIHDLNPQMYPGFFVGFEGKLKKMYSYIMNYIAMKKSDRIIAVSETTKENLLNLFGTEYFKKTNVVYEGVDQTLCESDKDIQKKMLDSLKKKHNLKNYILYVGNNRPHKNIKNVLLAFYKLKVEYNLPHKFVLIGQQLPKYYNLQKDLDRLKIGNSVLRLKCTEEELKAFYTGADTFVFCSLSEGFGLPLLEAMRLGTPVVTSNLSSMAEVAGTAAMLVDPYSIDSIASGILKVLNNDLYKKQLIQKGKERSKYFTWEKSAEETLKIYSEVLK